MPQQYERKTFTRSLDCILSESEIARFARDAAQHGEFLDAKDAEVAEAKEAAKHAKEAGDVLMREIRWALERVRTRLECRPVDCYEQYDPDTGKMETFRSDTGELIDTRNPVGKEDQPVLFHKPKDEVMGEGDVPEGPQDAEDRKGAGS